MMTNIFMGITTAQLRRAITIKERIEDLEIELKQILGSAGAQSNGTQRRRKGMSAAGRARIAAAQKARWAKVRGVTKGSTVSTGRRKMSAAGRKRIAAAAKARWAKVKAAG